VPDVQFDRGERQAIERLRWYMLLRWSGVAVLYGAGLAFRSIGHFTYSQTASNVLAPVVVAYNVVVWRSVSRWRTSPPRDWRRVYRIAGNAQCSADLIVLAVAFHFGGGLESVIIFEPVAVLVVAGLVLSELDSVLQGVLACVLVDVVAGAEASGHLGHVSLGLVDPARIHSARYVVAVLVLFDAVLLFVVALVVFISHRLRQREADLVRLYDAELATVARLEDLDRMKSDFLATVSHELRTPLTVIEGFASHLDRQWHDTAEDQRRDEVITIGRQAKRLHRLVANLLDLSAVEAGEANLELSVVDIVGLARSAIVSSTSPEAELVLTTGDAIWVRCDTTRTEQVLVNLLDNAAKYGAPAVTVTIVARDRDVMVCVEDAGPGVPEERREELFSRFAQLDHGRRGTSTGVGLGLALVRAYVAAQGGRVWYEAADGGGARFCVTLPLAIGRP
jgi:signal transduction histidine kinase